MVDDHQRRWNGCGLGRIVKATSSIAVLIVTLFPPSPAAAQPPTRRAAKAPSQPAAKKLRLPTVVFIAPRNVADRGRKVARVIGVQLRDMLVSFKLVWEDRIAPQMAGQLATAKRVARQHRALVVVWCDFAAGGKLHLYYSLPGNKRVLVRTVDSEASAQGRFETMGAIVRGGVEAMLSLRRLPRRVAPAPPPTPAPPRPAPRQRARSVSGALALSYGLAGYASQGPRVTHSGALALQLLLKRRWTVHLSYTAAPDIRAATDSGDAELTLHRHGLRLGGGYRWPLGRFYIGVEASFVLDLLDRRHETSGTMEPKPAPAQVNLGLEAMARVGYRATRWLTVYTGLGALFMLLNRDYWVDGGTKPVLRPWTVQPMWVLGLELGMF